MKNLQMPRQPFRCQILETDLPITSLTKFATSVRVRRDTALIVVSWKFVVLFLFLTNSQIALYVQADDSAEPHPSEIPREIADRAAAPLLSRCSGR
jgi:hypothetical protein